MIVRKSNIASFGRKSDTPVFHALAWIEYPNDRRLAFVALGRDQENLTRFMQRDVLIDGSSYFCINFQLFAPGPCRTGDTVGMIVARVSGFPA